MFNLRTLGSFAARQPFRAAAFNKASLRCISSKAYQHQFQASPGFIKFSEDLELDIRKRLDALPGAGKIFQNPDGTARNPNDSELKEVAGLSVLGNERRLAFIDALRLSTEQARLYADNQTDLREYISSGKEFRQGSG